MKKVITVCLCLILALSALSVACAEDFTIHAGVMFGDTTEEVKTKEDLELLIDLPFALEYRGTIAGYEETIVDYMFEDDKLYDANYSFPNASYEDLLNLLKNKYGEPIGIDNEAYFLILGNTLRDIINRGEDKIPLYEAWVVENDEYNVKVELAYTVNDEGYGKISNILVFYHKYTEDDLDKAKQDALDGIKAKEALDIERSKDL